MKNQIKTILLLGVLSLVLLGISAALGKGFLLGALVLSLAMNVGAWFFSDKLVLRMHGAQEVSPRQAPGLHRMAADGGARAAAAGAGLADALGPGLGRRPALRPLNPFHTL